MSTVEFEGVLVPNVTPFTDGEVDEESLRRLVDHLIDSGASGIVPCGTTGESATLSHDEHIRVIEVVAEQVAGRVPVVAGIGTNDTRETISLIDRVEELDLQGYLVVCPYYNRPSQDGIVRHFQAVSGATSRSILVYNIPMRTGRNIDVSTVVKLSRIPNIVGIKDASGDINQTMNILGRAGDSFSVLSGEDHLLFSIACLGGHGGIMASAHVLPGEFLALYNAVREGNLDEARRLHYHLLPLVRVMFKEPNPAPAKAAMKLLGIIDSDELRMPLMEVSAACREDIAGVLHGLKLI
ncbi:MAG: 4-hydroxy-tetrahydrodipicolinate synthase [Actinobacteria bacterium]|nr:4-hydroxy-tetrahydrodipicolinate synthase [Actinomycetota bacterium]MCG2817618.1 4-hydroxy-tetrahydrodipicolinate synthase [Actinomycetes bacterium]MBU4178566.1 4-hydroxy-tetrahydrodipicolinate synthase [Actinomycetota bacterium]MBU4217602.1 4-hydroxy-tetrahydrodipicolinate synthase [Actinomycetota bacterium]MBU4358071.1 4-hydroxy-tetrahydrodipicolinate synthase [Actinomycetota bacterium]